MLRMLKRWLGWGADDDFHARAERAKRGRPSSATAHLFSKDPARHARAGKGAVTKKKPVSGTSGQPRPKGRPKPEFDPYNTGKFDRGASWEKISKSQR